MPSMAKRDRMIALVNQAHQLLDCFLEMDARDSPKAWERLVELQVLLGELRELRPAGVFRDPNSE